uniref:Uncharacterized protein n=1 Tax=Rhizophora mucronata TaxID=61149 RepID=A0A2P2NFS6_RHIMU
MELGWSYSLANEG